MPSFYIVSYMPLVGSPAGRRAAEDHDLQPFIDGSIRREPDLAHKFPAISCLCRADKFVPRLEVADVVAYMTKKRRYGRQTAQRYLTAIVRVSHIFETHADAAKWYRAKGFRLPANCIVARNGPQPIDRSHRIFERAATTGPARMHKQWERTYRLRAEDHPTFVATRVIFRNLSEDAPRITDQDLVHIFGGMPGTQNPGAHDMRICERLMRRLKIS